MRKKLDPDEFGIILLNAFMAEFFADEVSQSHSCAYYFDDCHTLLPPTKKELSFKGGIALLP